MKNSNFKKVICFILTGVLLATCALVNAGAKTILRGDVDLNGSIQPSDARLALRAAARLENLAGDALIAADADGNGKLLPNDARAILRVAARLDKFESPEIEITEETEAPSTEDTTVDEPTTDAPTTEEPTTEEPTTEEPTTQEPVTGPVEIGKGEYPEAIDAFFSGKFYMKSIITNDDGTESEVEMGIDGNKMEVVIPTNGMTMALFVDGETTYIKIKMGIWYVCEMTDALKEEGFDFDISNMTGNLQYGNVEDFKSIVKYKETLDGTEYTVYSFISENGSEICFYADSKDNIKSMITKGPNGNITSRYDIISLSSKIPNSMFKIKGVGYVAVDLEKLLDLMAGLAG